MLKGSIAKIKKNYESKQQMARNSGSLLGLSIIHFRIVFFLVA